MKRLPQSGMLGAAFGVPCVICFGEQGALKTLHCDYKAHGSCLKAHWTQNVLTLCRITNIRCPAEVAGCRQCLTEADLRGVIESRDVSAAEEQIRDLDVQNQQLINDLKKQSEQYRPMFDCAICLTPHEVEGCCTLPCGHRFCFESLQYHFGFIVRECRLTKLTCPVDGCSFDLRSEEHIHIFQQVLPEETYHKLQEFLTRDNPHIYECRDIRCEERVYLDEGDDAANLECALGHRFCARCDNGPHPRLTCDERLEQLEREQKDVEEKHNMSNAWKDALASGWKPCPKRCKFGGGYKDENECDHVTCECGHEFCWSCGVERAITLMHDNRWHKPSCSYHTKPSSVSEPPKWVANCPGCKRMPKGTPCPFFDDDGYPDSYLRRFRSHAP